MTKDEFDNSADFAEALKADLGDMKANLLAAPRNVGDTRSLSNKLVAIGHSIADSDHGDGLSIDPDDKECFFCMAQIGVWTMQLWLAELCMSWESINDDEQLGD